MKKGWINFHVLKKMQPILIIAAYLGICIGAAGQSAEKVRFAFMMVVDKQSTTIYFSSVFKITVDKRGDAMCGLKEKEDAFRSSVADTQFDVMTSDYFDSRVEAEEARNTFIEMEKQAGRKVTESTTVVADCN